MADLHTHVLPGVDDGAADMDSALDTLQALYSDGVDAIAATPHLNASDPEGSLRTRADAAWDDLVERAQGLLPQLRLYRGFEIQLDTPSPDLSDPGLRLAGSRFALVEFFAFTVPRRSAALLGRIVADGYVPILAHPERYAGYDRNYDPVPEWRDAGVLLQLNSGSLLGDYGHQVQLTAHRFLSEGWVDFIASDNHARQNRSPSLRSAWDYLVENGLKSQAALLLAANPHCILSDELPLQVGPLEFRKGLLARLARALRPAR